MHVGTYYVGTGESRNYIDGFHIELSELGLIKDFCTSEQIFQQQSDEIMAIADSVISIGDFLWLAVLFHSYLLYK